MCHYKDHFLIHLEFLFQLQMHKTKQSHPCKKFLVSLLKEMNMATTYVAAQNIHNQYGNIFKRKYPKTNKITPC
jgi:hypothetical protein